MIVALLIGFVTGWAISVPIGPVNATAITRTLRHGYKQGVAVGLGAALMDVIYCGGAAQIHEFLQGSPIINLCFQALGCVLLVIFGIRALRSSRLTNEVISPEADEKTEETAVRRMKRMHVDPKGYLAAAGVGVALYATNVAAVPEWIFISALWRSYGLLENGVLVNAIYAIGAGLGTAAWFLTLVRFIARRQRGFKQHTLAMINRFAGICLLCFGVYFLYQIVYRTNWPAVRSGWTIVSG